MLYEYLAFFAGAREIVVDLMVNATTRVVPHSRSAFLDGLRLYFARSDNGCSLVDCSSMEIMRREDLTEVLTNDRHFDQEGFRAVLGDS